MLGKAIRIWNFFYKRSHSVGIFLKWLCSLALWYSCMVFKVFVTLLTFDIKNCKRVPSMNTLLLALHVCQSSLINYTRTELVIEELNGYKKNRVLHAEHIKVVARISLWVIYLIRIYRAKNISVKGKREG